MAQSTEVIVDALPYIDQGYDEPGVREAVGCVLVFLQNTSNILKRYYSFTDVFTYHNCRIFQEIN